MKSYDQLLAENLELRLRARKCADMMESGINMPSSTICQETWEQLWKDYPDAGRTTT